MTISDICVEVKRKIDRAIKWADDSDTIGLLEHWQSHADRILQDPNYRTRDDCDGFALTAAEMLHKAGIPKEDIRLVYCTFKESGAGHLVTTVDDISQQCTWIIDNNEARPVMWTAYDRNYDYHSYMSYDNLGEWLAL